MIIMMMMMKMMIVVPAGLLWSATKKKPHTLRFASLSEFFPLLLFSSPLKPQIEQQISALIELGCPCLIWHYQPTY